MILIYGCSTTKIPATAGDPANANVYGYHPLDPLPVKVTNNSGDPLTNAKVLTALPDETMRLAIGEISMSGGITFTTATAGYAGRSYVVVLDYIKFNTQSFPVKLDSDLVKKNERKPRVVKQNEADVIVPLYIGVGLRLTANITVHKGEINLGNLFAIGAQASAQKVSGTLIVQTLGISGENISSAIPMPSEINVTTIQNAILALGTIKANIYDASTTITPRVVGVYNNLGGGSTTINRFISSILETPIEVIVK